MANPPQPQDVAAMEKQSGDMIRASIAGYGVMPDPQLATEAMLTGSSPGISYALAQGDPALQSALLSQPIGESQFQTKGVSPPTSLADNPYAFDPKQHADYVVKMKNDKLNNSFESFNDAPAANYGWYQSVLQGSPDQTRKWQHFLADRGYYGTSDANGQNFKKGEANGYNTKEFQDAMKQWSLAYFLPQAIVSRDLKEMTHARQFLSMIGFDPDTIAQSMSHDDAKRMQMVDGWLSAQGPDGNKMDALNAFGDHFGSAALPDQLNHLRGDGVFGSLGNFLGHIPGVGNLLGTTPQQLDDKLTDAEKEVLNPSLQAAHDNSGFLGKVGDVLSAPSKALVTAGYFFGDVVSGHAQGNMNPFDADSTIRKQADKFVDNPTREMFGEQFTKDHPWLTTITNVLVNVADDPLTFIPFAGSAKLAKTLEESGGKMTKIEKATGGLVSHRVGALRQQELLGKLKPTTIIRSLSHNPDLQKTITKGLDPMARAQEDVSRVLASENMDHGLVRDLLGAHTPEAEADVEKILSMKGNQHAILDFLRDPKNNYGHNMTDLSFLANRHQYDKILRNIDKLSDGKALHVWNTVHMNDTSNLVLLSKPKEAVEGFRNAAMVAGVDPKEIRNFVNEFWKSSGDDFKRLNLADGMVKKIEEVKGKKWTDDFHAHRNNLRPKANETGKPPLLYGVQHVPGKNPEELSWRTNAIHFTKDVDGAYTATQLNSIAETIRTSIAEIDGGLRANIDAAARQLSPAGVADGTSRALAMQQKPIKELAETHSLMIRDKQKELNDMASQYGGTAATSPAPMMTTQAAVWAHLPYTASEIMSFDHKFLRKAETIQSRAGIDKAMGYWKSLVLSKPSTTARIIFGDESSRVHINLLANDPRTWLSYMKDLATHRGKDWQKEMDQLLKENPDVGVSMHAMSQQGAGSGGQIPMVAGEVGYRRNLTRGIEQHYSKQQWVQGWMTAVEKAQKEGKDWEKAGKDFLHQHIRGESDEARQLRDFVGAPSVKKGAHPMLDGMVETQHYAISTFLHHDPADSQRMHMWNWVRSGKVDQKVLKDLEHKYAHNSEATYILPQIGGDSVVASLPGGALKNTLDWYHERSAMAINRARMRGWVFKSKSERDRLTKFYTDADGIPTRTKDQIAKMAEASATQWVQKNTYQGARTVAGSALRTVAPFWGASANSNKFYLHTLMEHPELAMPLFQGEEAITKAQQSGGLRMNIPFMGAALSKLGMQGGDQFTWEPFNAAFLTREGFGGFVPGMGPVFNFGVGVAPTGIRDFLQSSVPGMQTAGNQSPLLPWVENLASAASLATGHDGFEAPIIGRETGYYKKLVDEKLQQMEATWQAGDRKGKEPTIEDAKRDVAANRALTGISGALLPVGLASHDEVKAKILDGEKNWSPRLSAADKATFMEKNAAVADYFKYVDPSTPNQPVVDAKGKTKESKQEILARSPWVLAYATGMGVSNLPGRVTAGDTKAQYKKDRQEGNISTMDPAAYLTKMRKQEDISQAWNAFDRVQSTYQEFLQTAGVSTNSPAAKTWRKQNYDWKIQALAKEFPEWGSTFVKQTSRSAVGQEYASLPFSTVSTFEVIPRNPALETKATTLWRAALIRRDQATSALQQVVANHGSQVEKEMILSGLATEMDKLAAQDPTFAAQIGRYRFSNIQDLISFQAGQAADQAAGFPTA